MALSDSAFLCGMCARDFYLWYRSRMGRQNYSKGFGCFNEAAAKSIIGEAVRPARAED